jgi:hypothetical protein
MANRHEADLDWLYGHEQRKPEPEPTRVMPAPFDRADRADRAPEGSAPRAAAPAPAVARPAASPPAYPPTPAYG